ncbi:hypothetical protein [Sinomonas gamaensis]|jgi:hypothetical protein|uniref:hypothetical protein n=1 Tax=Sinomonas gamaensis TaxID=2565624 RepID=UPI00110A0160|nr:hypothetical protein [Sinomonas gamaensis]
MTKLTLADLAAETAEMLPDRDTLWTFNSFNIAAVAAANSSVAANVATICSSANSLAAQAVVVHQS